MTRDLEELPGLVESPERIYLEPPCCVSPVDGRQWCKDNVWPIGYGDCEASGVEYVRADTLESLAAENERLREALKPFAIEPDPDGFLDVTNIADHFDAARKALSGGSPE